MGMKGRAARFAFVMAARIAPILLLSAGSASAQIGRACVEVIPPVPTTADAVTLRVFGLWLNSCTPRNPVLSWTANQFRVDTTGPPGDVCLAILTSFEMFVPLGRLAAGYYSVIIVHTAPPGSSQIGSHTFAVLELSATDFYTVTPPCRLAWISTDPKSD